MKGGTAVKDTGTCARTFGCNPVNIVKTRDRLCHNDIQL